MEPAETDVSGSLHFEVSDKEETAPVREVKVRFHHRVRCRRKKTPDMNPQATWFSKDDIASFRKREKHIFKRLVSSGKTSVVGDDDNEEVSFVGLASEKERKRKMKRVKESRSFVLGEQMQQKEDFYNNQDGVAQQFELDADSIAEFYSVYSKRATKAAHMRGMQISWHVENLLEEESTDADDDSHRSCSQRSHSQRSKTASARRSARSFVTRLTTAVP
eukprot:CAMPEP_0113643350 /NCGR_PEP_ID=MMETSP0017_2-20120614/22793_1 /TAXON_ID=2856 /ORGANISM="Cylindrotheca closterium" /LENGTH=218 /DNA_ID=CAMNT_0000554859 /DNA_START=67 /DNA_END=723 /DNA_ORIENTATION=+ /assembly_acc=CAM_ASM_000147